MVYCTKCGKDNEETAKFCVNCGAVLDMRKEEKRRGEDCFGPRNRTEEECFGLPYGGAIAGIIFGTLIILIGLATFMGQNVWTYFWPIVVIVVGLLIIAGALYRIRRRP